MFQTKVVTHYSVKEWSIKSHYYIKMLSGSVLSILDYIQGHRLTSIWDEQAHSSRSGWPLRSPNLILSDSSNGICAFQSCNMNTKLASLTDYLRRVISTTVFSIFSFHSDNSPLAHLPGCTSFAPQNFA